MQRAALFAVVPMVLVSAVQAAPPAQALKYHEALLKRPNNEALFERFFGAWLDEQPQETLEVFLTDRAKEHGGQEWAILARYQLRRGQEEAALDSLGKAMAAVPDDPGLAMERGKLRLRRLDFAGAREDLTKVVAGKDEALSLEAGKLVGKAWLRQGNSDEAVKAWDTLLAAHAADEDLLEDLVEAAASEGAMAQALGYADKLIAATKDPYQKAVRGMRKGDLLAKAGRNDDALAAYSATLKEVGEGSWLEHELLAQVEKIFRKQDRLDDLKKELGKLAEEYPRRLLIQRQLAKLEAAQGGMDSAIGRFREILKRSPGDKELQEEFVRLLVDGERFEDAAAELQRLLVTTPGDSGLWLQLAAVRSRLQKPDEVLDALKKAHALLGTDVPSGIRIAGLMMQYGLGDQAEALLKQLAATPGAGTAAQEALASYYGRSQRKADAVAILKQVGASDDEDTVLRAAGAVAGLGENGEAFQMLSARMTPFGGDAHFLSALGQASLAAGKATDAVAPVLKLVRMAKQPAELGEAVALATRVIRATGKTDEWRETLTKQSPRSVPETCLLAALHEAQGDPVSGAELLKPSSDPTAIRFLAAMLDKRGEFDDAITALSKLSGTEEGRKAGYFKELSELQQRGGKNAEALATVERWRQIAPGDKAAWIASSRLLKETGKPDQAVKIARQAVSKFEGDADLTAGLATLQEDASQWAEAESIYWRLYDEAASPSDQARWAGQLARLAGKTGRLPELEEKLQERARGNRRSLGPILAQAELQRVIGDEDKRRDLMAEAVRLQPKDVDLRLQLSTLEEQAGNPDRALAVLEEIVASDPSGKARGALAQAYIRQGQSLKGLRELKLLAGKSRDPRAVESSAMSLADAKLFEEAITFIQEESAEAGDWRLRYLLGILLEEDGRDQEAVAVFMPLLDAKEELASKLPATASAGNAYNYGRRPDSLSPEGKAVGDLVSLIGSAYAHREARSSRSSPFTGGGSSNAPSFTLPVDAGQVRILAMTHLQNLASRVAGGDAIRAAVKGAGGKDADFVAGLIAASAEGESGMAKAMVKHPDHPGVVEWVVSSGEVSPEVLKPLLEHASNIDGWIKFEAGMQAMRAGSDTTENATPGADEVAWTLVFGGLKDVIAAKDVSQLPQMTWTVTQMMASNLKVSDAHKNTAKELVRQALARLSKEPQTPQIGVSILMAMNFVGTADEYVDQLNVVVRDETKAPDSQAGMFQARLASLKSYLGNATESEELFKAIFPVPTLENAPFATMPSWFGPLLSREVAKDSGDEEEDPSAGQSGKISLADIAKRLNRIESPVLRAWVAMKSKDATTAARILAGEIPRDAVRDVELLRCIQALDANKPVEAYDALTRMRAAITGSPDVATWAVNAQLGVALRLPPADQTARAEDLKTLLIQAQRNLGPGSGKLIAFLSGKLGLEEWGKRFLPPPSATGTPANPNPFSGVVRRSGGSSQRQASPLDRVRKFVAENKHEAAAMEALRLMRGYRSHSSYSGDDDEDSLLKTLGKEDLNELLKIIDPGDSKSLVKRLEYASLCRDFGKSDLAQAMLEKLYQERPSDPVVAARYLFLVPERDRELRLKLFNTFAASPEFISQIGDGVSRLEEKKNHGKTAYTFFEALADWLGKVDPATLANTDLGWISYYGKQFFDGDFDPTDTTSLLGETKARPANDNGVRKWQSDIGHGLALAMLRQPAIAEEGFRLLTGCKAWPVSPEEADTHARAALDGLAGARSKSGDEELFNGALDRYGSEGGALRESSSVNWLLSRLSSGVPAEDVLPAAFVEGLQKQNPRVGAMVASLKALTDLAGVKREWTAGNLKPQPGLAGAMVRQALVKRATAIPGAAGFFSERLVEAMPKNADPTKGGLSAEVDTLMAATFAAGAAGSEADRTAVAKLYSKLIYGDKVDWAKPRDPERLYRAATFTSRYFVARLEPGTASRMSRTFYSQGIPVAREEKDVSRLYGERSFGSAAELESHLQAIGWLDGADTWTPDLAWTLSLNKTGNTTSVVKTRAMANAEMAEHFDSRLRGDVSSLVRKLSSRDEHRFGALMTAAAFSGGEIRGRLATRAFTECAADLQKLPPDRIEEISMMLSWVPENSAASLPPVFRESLKKLNAHRNEELLRKVKEYLARKTPPAAGINPFIEASALIQEVAPVDVDLAVKILIETDKRFTAGLAKGGTLALKKRYYGFDQPLRDEALSRLYEDSDSVLRNNLSLGLKFHNRLAANPEGARFSCFGILAIIGRHMYFSGDGDTIYPREESLIRMSDECDPEVRTLAALAAFSEYPRFWQKGRMDAQWVEGQIKVARDQRAAHPVASRFAELSGGISGLWKCSENTRNSTLRLMIEMMNDESLPPIARLHLFNAAIALHGTLGNYSEFVEPLARLYAAYLIPGRSPVNPFSFELLRHVADEDSTFNTVPYVRKISDTFWSSYDRQKAAGAVQGTMTDEMYEVLFALAAVGGDEARMDELFEKARPTGTGNIVLVDRLVRRGKFDMAAKLMGPADTVMARKNRAGLYAPDLEAEIDKWRESKPDPAVLLRFEAMELDMTPGEGDWKPREGLHERALRLAAAYQQNPPPGLEARLNILNVIFNRDRLAAWEIPDAYIEWARQRPLSQILADRYADSPVSGHDLDRGRVSGWESYIHFHAAFVAALRGDPTLLRGVREAFRKDPAVKGKDGTQLSTYYYNYVEETALNLAIAVSRGETQHFDKILEVFSDMTVDSMEPSMPNRSKERLQGELAICQFLANWIGAPERFEAVVNRLPDMAEVGVKFARNDGLARFLELVNDNAEWLRDEFTPCREALVEAIMTRPQLAACFPGDASWTGRYEKSLKSGEFLAWARNPPSEWGFQVRPAVDAFAARKLREQKQPELAMETYRRALGECQGEGWLQFSNLMRIELAEMLMNNKRRDEARALLLPIRVEDVAEASKARYRQACSAVGPGK